MLHDAATPPRLLLALRSGFVVDLLAIMVELSLAFLSAPALRRLEATDSGTALAFYSQLTALLEQRLVQS